MNVFRIIPEFRILRMTFQKVILKMLNEDYISFSDLFSVRLRTINHLIFKIVDILVGKLQVLKGAQWLSGRVLDSRPKGSGFEPHWRHCVVVLEQDTFILA